MASKQHWEQLYATTAPHTVSWFQEHADHSLALIRATGVARTAALIDVGGGASTLVDDLLAEGYSSLTVLDLSSAALAAARHRLGALSHAVTWIEGDITDVPLPHHAYDLWHDRAVFHFLTTPAARQAYVQALRHAVKPGGHVIVATFAEDGPAQCSGLPVMRYTPTELHAALGSAFTLVQHEREEHHTPAGNVQHFVYGSFRKKPA